ncbi:MAG: PPC domain-containing protein [Gemmataceae bacterium]|nr:PPC domain-containing protein [Gemmataceae bacterium]
MRRPLLAVAFLTVAVAFAQQPGNLYPQPRIASIFPVGAKAGTTVDVTALGTDLEDATALVFTHPGIKGDLIPPPPEPPADPKKKDPPKKKTPPPTEAKFKVSVAADVPPGAYDVRVVNKYGVSNPRLFVVGDKLEVNEKEPNNDTAEAQKVELGTTINGIINNQVDVDYSSFAAKAGQRILIHCAASSIDSKLKPLVEVFAPDGKRLANARNYQDADALADVAIPADGEYLVRLTEFAHQAGSADHFYRLTIAAMPWIDAVYPPIVEPGKPANVTLFGRNLPGGKPVPGMTIDGRPIDSLAVTVTPPVQPGQTQFRRRVDPPTGLQDSFEHRLPGSNAIPLYVAGGPVTLEKDADNNKPEAAEAIAVPCELAGRIEKRYDRDWYSFTAKKDDKFTIELFADRIGSNMDGYLTIRNAANKQDIANEGTLDDDQESLHPQSFFSRNTDPVPFKFTAPADGTYQIMVGSRDANVNYGPRSFYRLRISAAKPDFRAVVMPRSRDIPTTVVARPDGEVAFDVFVQRLDGFTGIVTLTAEGLPAGVTAAPASIGTNQKWGTLVLSAAGTLPDAVAAIKVKATGTINGQPVVREARPASITWGVQSNQNTPTVTRLDQSLVVATRGDKAHFRIKPDLAAATIKKDGKDEKLPMPLVVKPGDKITVPVKVTWQDKDARPNPINVVLEPSQQNMQQAPVNVNNGQPMAIAKDKADANVVVDIRNNAVPGTYWIPLRGETTVKYAKDPMDKNKKDITVVAYAPPFEVKVIPTSLGKLSAQSPGNLKQGMTAEVTIRVERQYEFDGPFALKIDLPKEAAGVTVDASTIPPGASEVKVKFTAAKDAKLGNLNNIAVTATAKWDGQYDTKHETKFNLNVVK